MRSGAIVYSRVLRFREAFEHDSREHPDLSPDFLFGLSSFQGTVEQVTSRGLERSTRRFEIQKRAWIHAEAGSFHSSELLKPENAVLEPSRTVQPVSKTVCMSTKAGSDQRDAGHHGRTVRALVAAAVFSLALSMRKRSAAASFSQNWRT
jgi:hypothetical protein